ncbi:MAG: hypothetical protein HDQ87_09515 [Clostridia bacterium]|nr:hypothetical protein [Clostridia bacterium]
MDICEIMHRVFAHDPMATFVAQASLPLDRYVEIIAGAPIPLQEKAELLRVLADETKSPAAAWALQETESALQALETKLGDFLLISECWYDPQVGLEKSNTLWPCASLDQARIAIRQYMDGEEFTENDCRWFHIEKWELNEDGKYISPYMYVLIGDEVTFFAPEDDRCYSREEDGEYVDSFAFYMSNNLYLPLPVQVGDIVCFDCAPFVSKTNGVILETKVNGFTDCCTVQAMHRSDDIKWSTGAVIHSHVFPHNACPQFSPLYRLAPAESDLPEADHILTEVSEFLKTDEKGGHTMFDFLRGDGKDETDIRKFMAAWPSE